MKFIDEKGRIFGIINIIDLFIILIVIIIGLGIFKFQDIRESVNIFDTSEKVDIYITYNINDVRMASYEGIKIGDVFYVKDTNQIIGEVIYKSYSNSKISTIDSNGKFVYSEVPDHYDVLFKIKAKGSYNDTKVTINGKDIHIGESTEINSRFSKFTAIIYNIEFE